MSRYAPSRSCGPATVPFRAGHRRKEDRPLLQQVPVERHLAFDFAAFDGPLAASECRQKKHETQYADPLLAVRHIHTAVLLELGRRIAIGDPAKASPCERVNAVLNEMYAGVAERDVHAAGINRAGCGRLYIKLLSQLFGDRLVANATGCSSIYGGNLPTTPWTQNATAAARPGPTRCSRTTPSSASACASADGRRAGPQVLGTAHGDRRQAGG